MTRLWHWVLFEVGFGLASASGLFGCYAACRQIFTTMPKDPLLFVLQGTGGVLVGAYGLGFALAIVFLIVLAIEVNPEVYLEEHTIRIRN